MICSQRSSVPIMYIGIYIEPLEYVELDISPFLHTSLPYYLRFLYYLFLKSIFFPKVEPGTLLLRLVNSQEVMEGFNTSLLVWFTDCDNFSNLNYSNFEICLAGVGTRRLYYDDDNRYTTQNCYSSFTVIQLHACCNLGKK